VWKDTFYGETMLVNGKVWPVLNNVKKGLYRLRLLNGCNTRTLNLEFCPNSNTAPCPAPATFQLLGQEGGLLGAPVSLTEINLGPAERADVVVDFGVYANDSEVYLVNSEVPNVSGAPDIPNVMKFVVGPDVGHTTAVPSTLRTLEVLDENDAIVERTFELAKGAGDVCSNFVWEVVTTDGLNGSVLGSRWDDVTEFPERGTTEIWSFINRSGMMHPMHMHLVMFQVLDRQDFDDSSGDVVPVGEPAAPPAYEAGWKDTVQVPPGQIVRVIARFDDYTGLFPYHCHIIEHEDHEMMREFQVVSCGNGDLEPTEECDDGNAIAGDGCYPTCEFEDLVSFYGEGEGGAVNLTVSGVPLSVPTSLGDTPPEVATAVAGAINANSTLQNLGITAVAQGNGVVTNGTYDVVTITDPGLSTSAASIPALSPGGLAGLAALLLATAAVALRRRRA
jgi:cysteine-rich repeat protein